MRDGCLRCGRGTRPSWPVIIGLTIRLAGVGNAPRLKPGFRWNISSISRVTLEHTGLSPLSYNAMSLGLTRPLVSARHHLIPRIPCNFQGDHYYRTLLARLSQKLSLLYGGGPGWIVVIFGWSDSVLLSLYLLQPVVWTISQAPGSQLHYTSNM